MLFNFRRILHRDLKIRYFTASEIGDRVGGGNLSNIKDHV